MSAEEQELFEILDRSDPSGNWAKLATYLRDMATGYMTDVRGVCEDLGIAFLDLNQSEAFRERRWPSVDRPHLTDEGYSLAAERIVKEWRL